MFLSKDYFQTETLPKDGEQPESPKIDNWGGQNGYPGHKFEQ